MPAAASLVALIVHASTLPSALAAPWRQQSGVCGTDHLGAGTRRDGVARVKRSLTEGRAHSSPSISRREQLHQPWSFGGGGDSVGMFTGNLDAGVVTSDVYKKNLSQSQSNLISISELKAIVAASADFAAFKSSIAALADS